MTSDLERTQEPPGVDPELTKAMEFAMLKVSELFSTFGIVIDHINVRCIDPEALLNTYATLQAQGRPN